jgi:hypothetical protein
MYVYPGVLYPHRCESEWLKRSVEPAGMWMAEQGLINPEFRSYAADLGLKSGHANLPIGGFLDAIQENGVPGIAVQHS